MNKTLQVIFRDVDQSAVEAKRIAEERIGEICFDTGIETDIIYLSLAKKGTEGFILDIKDNVVNIYAGKVREFIVAVGRLLDILRKAADTGGKLREEYIEDIARYPLRTHYMPSHFGNSFEVAWPGEMQRYMEDMALAGAGGYGDWFDPNDMPDPYNPHVYCSTSMTLWKRKKEFLRIANRLGLDTMLWVAHNVGFVDQLRPEWLGKRDHKRRVQGQVLCPSNPEARAVCLKNHDNLFRDLSESGINIDKVCYGPYDDGGCACDRCQPYYPVFLSMVSEVHDTIRRYYPEIKGDICGWWASDEEMEQLKTFAAGTAKEWFSSFQFSATYNVFEIPPDTRSLIGDIPLSTFMHISFSHDNRDVYNKNGIHSGARRIKSVIGSFDKVGCLGFHTYNETFGDHFNVYVSSRLGRNPDLEVKELVRDYCRQMYGLREQDLEEMTDLLLEMEMLEAEKAGKWLVTLNRIKPYIKTPLRQEWAFEHVILKAELMELDYKIGTGKEWQKQSDIGAAGLLIRKRLELSETLWRNVYGFGILRHAFIPERMMPEWYGNYMRLFPHMGGNIKAGSVMDRNA